MPGLRTKSAAGWTPTALAPHWGTLEDALGGNTDPHRKAGRRPELSLPLTEPPLYP